MLDGLRNQLRALKEALLTRELTEDELEELAEGAVLSLVSNDVAYEVAERIVSELKRKLVGIKVRRSEDVASIFDDTLREILRSIFDEAGRVDFCATLVEELRRSKPFTVLFLGVNGVGKTTSIAKLASLLKGKGFTVVLACSDTYRAGAIEQLEHHAKKIGVKMIKQKYGADPAAVAYDAIEYARAHHADVVLLDTAGRMYTKRNLMDEMKKIVRVAQPNFTFLVVDALAGNDAVRQAREFLDHVGFDGVFLAKFDADFRGGAALSVVYETKKPIVFVGTGQRYADIRSFNADEYISALLG